MGALAPLSYLVKDIESHLHHQDEPLPDIEEVLAKVFIPFLSKFTHTFSKLSHFVVINMFYVTPKWYNLTPKFITALIFTES